MLCNVDVCKEAFSTFEDFELMQGELLRTGRRRYKIGCEYEFSPERAEEWLKLKRCAYVC